MVQTINPAFFVNEEAYHFLEERCIYRISFDQLSQIEYPWEVNFQRFRHIEREIDKIEKTLRASHPDHNLAVLMAESQMFWLYNEELEKYFELQQKTIREVITAGAFPTWKMTSAELAGGHIENLRHIILAAAHDDVLLDQLRRPLGEHFLLIHREFELGEKYVYQMLEYVKKYGPSISLAMQESFVMMERCRVTFEAIQRGEAEIDHLGYTLDNLERAKAILNQRCQQEFPAYLKQFDAIHQMMANAIREGENTQLIRLSRWELAIAHIGDLPGRFIGQAELITFEREKLAAIVQSREMELGPGVMGRKALDLNARATAAKQKPSQPPVPEPKRKEPVPDVLPEGETQETESVEKKYVHRMAFTSRERR